MSQPIVLFLHNNYPAQFGGYTYQFFRSGYKVVYISEEASSSPAEYVSHHLFRRAQNISVASNLGSQLDTAKRFLGYIHEVLKEYPRNLVRAVVSHSGWGCGLYAPCLFPDATFISYLEWWFDPVSPLSKWSEKDSFLPSHQKSSLKLYERNASVSLELSQASKIVTPSKWQRSQLPRLFSKATDVIHEGIDTSFYRFNPRFRPPNIHLTYTSRGLEPMRGFHHFIDILCGLLPLMPLATVTICGQDKAFYGSALSGSILAWAKDRLNQSGILNRVKFRDWLDKVSYVRLLKSSHYHFYLSAPFVPSWSILEAASCGATIVTYDLEMMREFLPDYPTIWLQPFQNQSNIELLHSELCVRSLTDYAPAQVQSHGIGERFDSQVSSQKISQLIPHT